MEAYKKAVIINEFQDWLRDNGFAYEKEVDFRNIMNTDRKFRADYELFSIKRGKKHRLYIIVEINGGQWISGRHTRGGKCYENDLKKLNIASVNGYYILQYTYEMLARNEYIEDFLKIKQQIQTF